MLLAIDTSTNLASVALVETTDGARPDGSPASDAGDAGHAGAPVDPTPATSARLLAELTWDVGRRHSVELLERIQWLLASRGATMAQLTALAVATGPGSFNGARVAVATAKSLAFALRLPLVALSTLDVIAWGAGPAGPRWALLDAGRGEVYVARYDAPPTCDDSAALAAWGPAALADDGAVTMGADMAEADAADTVGAAADGGADTHAGAASEGQSDRHGQAGASTNDAAPIDAARYHLLTPPQLAAHIARVAHEVTGGAAMGEPSLLCGEWRAATQAALTAALAARGVVARYDATPRRGWGLATLALARLATQTGVIADNEQLAALEPLYLRRPAITTSAKRALRS